MPKVAAGSGDAAVKRREYVNWNAGHFCAYVLTSSTDFVACI